MENVKVICGEKLRLIANGLTADDKKKAEVVLDYSRQTISDYLKGEVKKVDVAMSLIDFFSPIVTERISKLKNLQIA